jgi:CHAT domain-containing protein/tetratricopeptide (TPR) repeat protein
MNLQLFARPAGLLALLFCSNLVAAQPAPPGTAKGPPQTPELKEYLKERARAPEEVGQLLRASKFAEAVARWEKVLARARKVFGPFHPEVDSTTRVLAQLHEFRKDFPAARKVREQVIAIRIKLYGAKDWRVTDARWELERTKRLTGLDAADLLRLMQAEVASSEVVRLHGQGQTTKALPIAKEALATRAKLLGEAHPSYATSLNNLAALYQDLGEYGKALPLHEQARDLRKRLLGEDHPLYALSLSNLAVLYQDKGEYGKALPLLQQARDLRKRLLGEAHLDYASSLHNLAFLYRAMGEYGKALPLYEQAKDLSRRVLGEAHPLYATSLNNLAVLYQDLGEYGKALPLFEQARDLDKRLRGEAHPSYATSLNNLAALYQALGEYGKALPLCEQAKDLSRRVLGEAHPLYATSLNDLATLYQALGEYGKALPLCEQAKDLSRRVLGEAHPHYATNLNNLAALYKEMGEYGKALPLYEQAKDLSRRVLGEAHPLYATSLNNLAVLYQAMGEYGKALPLLQQAHDLNKRLRGETHPSYARSLHNLAALYQALGEYGKALPLYEQARDLNKRLRGEAHPSYATSLNNLAALYKEMGEYGKALPLCEQARDLYKRLLGEAHPDYAQSLNYLAALYRAMNNTSEGAKIVEQSRALWQAFLDRTFAAQSGRQRANLLGQHRYTLYFYLSFALDADTAPAPLYRAALGWKGALSARQAEERLLHDRPELRPLAEELRLARASLARVANRQPANDREQIEWRALFDRLEKEKEDLELRLAQKSAAYLRALKLRQADAAQVSAALPRDAALVDFLEYNHISPPPAKKGRWKVETRLLALVLRRDRPPALVQLGPATEIDAAVQAWRRAVQAYQNPQAAAAELSRRVWQPLHKHLAGAHTVLLAPDGVLCGLSFAALPGSKAGTYLIEDVALGYVSSGRHVLELAVADDGPRGQGLVAVGGLVYGQSKAEGTAAAKKSYGDLPGTRLEAEQISRLFRQQFPTLAAPRLLGGAETDADALTVLLAPAKGAARPRYLHLATHGFFEQTPAHVLKLRHAALDRLPFDTARQVGTYARNPLLLSGLVLAGANRDRENGILRAEELAELDLRGCEVAVLSACETGLGRVDPGEGVQGLQWAFQAAGARSLVVSLWKVHDAATSVLMEEFYSNLWHKKLSRLEALRQAQLTVLRNPGRVLQRQRELRKLGVRGPEDEPAPLPPGGAPAAARSHPALWAAFILSGDTGPIVEGKP